jgi:hypothetical protein
MLFNSQDAPNQKNYTYPIDFWSIDHKMANTNSASQCTW